MLKVKTVGITDNFFVLGGNSLLVTTMVYYINKILQQPISVKFLFEHPTIKEIAETTYIEHDEVIVLEKEATLDHAIKAFDNIKEPSGPPQNILITGATGFLGKYLLSELLTNTSANIYCLIRSDTLTNALGKLKNSLLTQDLWQEKYGARIIPVLGDIAKPYLGIQRSAYEILTNKIDTIYHNAVLMNHLVSYKYSEQANVDGTKEILRFACNGKLKSVHYISTISVFSESSIPRYIDETTSIDNEQHYNSSGYCSSKWVSEKLIFLASNKGIPCNIYRPGLVIWNSKNGNYDETQWGYKFLKSCFMLKAFPAGIKSLYPTMPVDNAAKIIVFFSQQRTYGNVYHIWDPQCLTLDKILQTFNLAMTKPLQFIPVYDWLQLMTNFVNTQHELPLKPFLQEFLYDLTEQKCIKKLEQINSIGNYFKNEITWNKLLQEYYPSHLLNNIKIFIRKLEQNIGDSGANKP